MSFLIDVPVILVGASIARPRAVNDRPYILKLQKDPSPAADSRQDRAVRTVVSAAKSAAAAGISTAMVLRHALEVCDFLLTAGLVTGHHVLKAHLALGGGGLGLPHAGLFLALGARGPGGAHRRCRCAHRAAGAVRVPVQAGCA